MSLGEDIKEAIEDVGVGFTVLRDAGNISGEYLDFEISKQVTKPFIREYFLSSTLSYETDVITGDVIRFDPTDDNYLVMNKTPELFENSVIGYDCILYKANVSGELLRPSGETWDATWDTETYHKTPEWETIKAECYALQTEALYGHDLDTDEELAMIGVENHELYIPHSVGVQVLDRYQPASGEYYRVETIKTRRYSGVDVCELGEDRR